MPQALTQTPGAIYQQQALHAAIARITDVKTSYANEDIDDLTATAEALTVYRAALQTAEELIGAVLSGVTALPSKRARESVFYALDTAMGDTRGYLTDAVGDIAGTLKQIEAAISDM